MLRRNLFVIVLFLIMISCIRHNYYSLGDFQAERTKGLERQRFRKQTISNIIEKNLLNNTGNWADSDYLGAFWAMGLMNYRSEAIDTVIAGFAGKLSCYSGDFQRAYLELIFQLYPYVFSNEVELFSQETDNPKLYAMAIHYLIRNETAKSKQAFQKALIEKFSDWEQSSILTMLNYDLSDQPNSLPSLLDLLKHDFGNLVVVFSIQHRNRGYPGKVLIRGTDGKFIRDEQGKLFSMPQLARSASALPGYITNGNSPQGIYSIEGISFSENVFIGPSPNIVLKMPFETTPSRFFHKIFFKKKWYFELYRELLPKSWQDYQPIYESWYAGKAGRSEIIAHGSTINPEFYSNLRCYPMTPSLGCLTAHEEWSPVTGQCLASDQIDFVNQLIQADGLAGYLILVEIEDSNGLIDIEPQID